MKQNTICVFAAVLGLAFISSNAPASTTEPTQAFLVSNFRYLQWEGPHLVQDPRSCEYMFEVTGAGTLRVSERSDGKDNWSLLESPHTITSDVYWVDDHTPNPMGLSRLLLISDNTTSVVPVFNSWFILISDSKSYCEEHRFTPVGSHLRRGSVSPLPCSRRLPAEEVRRLSDDDFQAYAMLASSLSIDSRTRAAIGDWGKANLDWNNACLQSVSTLRSELATTAVHSALERDQVLRTNALHAMQSALRKVTDVGVKDTMRKFEAINSCMLREYGHLGTSFGEPSSVKLRDMASQRLKGLAELKRSVGAEVESRLNQRDPEALKTVKDRFLGTP